MVVDAAFDLNRIKVGLRGPAFGDRVFRCDSNVRTQQEPNKIALLEAYVLLWMSVGQFFAYFFVY